MPSASRSGKIFMSAAICLLRALSKVSPSGQRIGAAPSEVRADAGDDGAPAGSSVRVRCGIRLRTEGGYARRGPIGPKGCIRRPGKTVELHFALPLTVARALQADLRWLSQQEISGGGRIASYIIPLRFSL